MADKEATVYIVDLGSSMGSSSNGRSESDLEWSMRYVWDRLSTTVAASRKTWTVGVVGLRTDETNNTMGDTDGYENISILQPIGPMSMSSLRNLQTVIKPSETDNGDAVSAIVIALEMIEGYTKKLKYKRRIILVTDGRGPIDSDDLEDISGRINELGIELIVIGVDFDEPDYGFKEEDKPRSKTKNEALLKDLVSQCKEGVFGTMAQAVEELQNPRVKPVRLVRNYDGTLTLGNPEKYESAMVINVERYPKTKIARPPAASTVVIKSEPGGASQAAEAPDDMEDVEYTAGFSAVKNMRTYKVEDPDAPGGKKDVDFDSLAKGYTYGSTAVHISESEFNITKLETTKGFSIIGFIPFSKYEPFLNMGECFATVARKFDEKSEIALSSLIHALYELESYAVARIVVKDGKDPQLLLLMPSVELDLECLYDVPLPFAEDVRGYEFPPLDKVVTIGGNTLTKHRLLPDEKLNKAMSDYVDAMDISQFGTDDDGNAAEYASIEDSYSPIIHRINEAIRQRAVHPDEPVGPIPDTLLKFSNPPVELVQKAQKKIDALISASEVKKVAPKAKGKRARDTTRPVGGLDIEALLKKNKKGKISSDNSIPEFKQMLSTSEDESQIADAVKQMGQIVRSLITNSTGDSGYAMAIENIGVMREQLVDFEEPALYNDFMKDLKKRLLAGELGGDRREMWWKIAYPGNLGLIDTKESEASDVTEKEAKEFLEKR
ncbi:ATP-dependent DNA helicase II subunit 2 [Pleurostoma richardsiae]|uniref:ATP-dependent DNA helicase II subunit 2 n=1 Tax=Pleurostoma richardsiae TaxID=41990 RepID=A0AA38S8A5_9PEZI|nr:ATP-dependent DNA helicase II subunit 2 [Pleurostoma richardsiae]